jgi:hypothetical protein
VGIIVYGYMLDYHWLQLRDDSFATMSLSRHRTLLRRCGGSSGARSAARGGPGGMFSQPLTSVGARIGQGGVLGGPSSTEATPPASCWVKFMKQSLAGLQMNGGSTKARRPPGPFETRTVPGYTCPTGYRLSSGVLFFRTGNSGWNPGTNSRRSGQAGVPSLYY